MTDYNGMMNEYVHLRKEIDHIKARVDAELSKRRVRMAELEAEMTRAAHEEGLTKIATNYGTGYWSTHYRCTAANPEAFFAYILENERWDLIERRPSKTAVKDYVTAEGEPPPGVNFGAVRVFNVRESNKGV